MADEIVAFIEARLAEDEAMARAATAGPWLIDEGDEAPDHSLTVKGGPDQIPGVPGRESVVYWPHIWDETWPDFEHIARHDPARVLREVASKRRVVKAYVDAVEALRESIDRVEAEVRKIRYDAMRISVEALVTVWADHPDYKPQWQRERS